MTSILKVENVTKVYDNGFRAVDDISFSFDEGILGLVGPNGAGKSTLIKMSIGLIGITSGRIELLGKNASFENTHLESIGILHEKPAYPGHITIRNYLRHVSNLIGATRSDIESIIKLMGIGNYSDKKIGSLSAGMLQKFGLADAFLGYPNLVILDEPTSNLDPLNRKRVLDTIGALAREREMNFIISTHILGELERVFSNITIMDGGKVVLSGRLDDLIGKMFEKTYRVTAPGATADYFSEVGKVSEEGNSNFTIRTELSDEVFNVKLFEILKRHDIAPRYLGPVIPSLEMIFERALKKNDV